MWSLIKRFTREAGFLNVLLLSMVAGLLSVRLSFLDPYLQMACAVAATLFLIPLYSILRASTRYCSHLMVLSQSLALIFISGNLADLTAVFLILSLSGIGYRTDNYEIEAFRAFMTHILDAATTILAFSKLGEANPLMNHLIQKTGLLPALITSKIILVGAPLIYSRGFEKEQRRVFIQAVLLLGLSLAARNLFLILN